MTIKELMSREGRRAIHSLAGKRAFLRKRAHELSLIGQKINSYDSQELHSMEWMLNALFSLIETYEPHDKESLDYLRKIIPVDSIRKTLEARKKREEKKKIFKKNQKLASKQGFYLMPDDDGLNESNELGE